MVNEQKLVRLHQLEQRTEDSRVILMKTLLRYLELDLELKEVAVIKEERIKDYIGDKKALDEYKIEEGL